MVAARAQQRLVGAAACPGCTPCPPAGRLAAAQGQPAARSQRERVLCRARGCAPFVAAGSSSAANAANA